MSGLDNPSASGNPDPFPVDLDLPVLPSEWRRVPRASLEQVLQFSKWHEPGARARRRELELQPGYRCSVEFVLT